MKKKTSAHERMSKGSFLRIDYVSVLCFVVLAIVVAGLIWAF